MKSQSQIKAQVWISVVIYTLVGITAIGLVLLVAQPRISEIRDSITIKQTIEAFHSLDSTVRSVLVAPGNRRQLEFSLTKGEVTINPETDTITWEMISKKKFSEPGTIVREGGLAILTDGGENGPWTVTVTLSYEGVTDIIVSDDPNKREPLVLQKAAQPYKLSIENLGAPSAGQLQQVNIKVLS